MEALRKMGVKLNQAICNCYALICGQYRKHVASKDLTNQTISRGDVCLPERAFVVCTEAKLCNGCVYVSCIIGEMSIFYAPKMMFMLSGENLRKNMILLSYCPLRIFIPQFC